MILIILLRGPEDITLKFVTMSSKVSIMVITTASIIGFWGTRVDLLDFYNLVTGRYCEFSYIKYALVCENSG